LAAVAAAHAAELRRRSAALRHEPVLPRPLVVNEDVIASSSSVGIGRSAELTNASSLVLEELVTLLKHDAFKYPVREASVLVSGLEGLPCGLVGED
jgi:hypothetical protein